RAFISDETDEGNDGKSDSGICVIRPTLALIDERHKACERCGECDPGEVSRRRAAWPHPPYERQERTANTPVDEQNPKATRKQQIGVGKNGVYLHEKFRMEILYKH